MKRMGLVATLILLSLAAWMPDIEAGPGDGKGEGHDQNVIESIRVQEGPDSVKVIVSGAKTPSFTVFKLSNPPRVFIDIAGADVSRVASPIRVDDGVVDQVVTMQIDDERKAVGRVVVGLDQKAPYKVSAQGNDLIMEIAARPRAARAATAGEIRELEDRVRARLKEQERQLERKRETLERELTLWEKRREEAKKLAEEQQRHLAELTEELNRASKRFELIEQALQRAEAERKSLEEAREGEEAKRKMAAQARRREEELARAAKEAREALERRRKAAEEALTQYNRQKSHLDELKAEITASKALLAKLRSEQLVLQQSRMREEERLARLRQDWKEMERKKVAAQKAAEEAQARKQEAERRLAELTRQRREAERSAGKRADELRAEERRIRKELEAARAELQARKRELDSRLAQESTRLAEVARQRKAEQERIEALRREAQREEERLARLTEASRKALAATREAQAKLERLRTAQAEALAKVKEVQRRRMAEEERAKAAAELRQREEERAKVAADSRAKEEERAKAAAELRRKEEEKARAAAQLRQREEALMKAMAEAARKEKLLAKARRDRFSKGTKASKDAELKARQELAAAKAKVARLQQEAETRRAEAAALRDKIARLEAQEAELSRQVREAAERLDTLQSKTKTTAMTTEAARAEARRAQEAAREARSQVEDARRRIARLQEEAAEAMARVAQARKELGSLREQAARAKEAASQARAAREELKELQAALREARKKAKATARALERTRREAKAKEHKARELEKRLAEAKAGGEATREKAEKLAQRLAELLAQAERLKEQAQERQQASAAELDGLRREVARLAKKAEEAERAAKTARELAEKAERRAEGSRRGQDDVAAKAAAAARVAAKVASGKVGGGRRVTAKPTMKIKDIRFVDENDRSKIIVEHTGKADFMLQEGDDGTVILYLDGAKLPRALERTMDTSELPTPVRSVSSFGARSKTGDVRIAVQLDEPSESRVYREKGRLVWTFLKSGAPSEGGTMVGMSKASHSHDPYRSMELKAMPYQTDRVGGYQAPGEGGGGIYRAGTRVTNTNGRRFTGKRITLDLRQADIHNVLRLLAKEGRINIIASEEVRGELTLHLERIPWDQALDVILKTKGLTQSREGDIIWITPIKTLREQQKVEMEVKKARTELQPLEVRLVTVNYAKPDELMQQASTLLSKRGTIAVDERTKTMIIKDVPDHAEAVEDLIRRLDTQTPLVLIEARIVEVSSSSMKDLGIQWGGDFMMSPARGNPTGLVFPSTVGVRGGADERQILYPGVPDEPNFVVNLPAAVGGGSGGALGFTFGSLGGAANLNVRLSALEEEGNLKIVSAPKITTMDNQEATISQGVSIPIAVVSAQGVNTVFFDANLELRVTPQVTQDGHVVMQIFISKNTPDFSRTGARGDPTILRKQTTTTMMVKDGDTTVIGGIYTQEISHNLKKVPFFGDIPILGSLFSFEGHQSKRSELLIFITPRIVNRAEAVVKGGKAGAGATFK